MGLQQYLAAIQREGPIVFDNGLKLTPYYSQLNEFGGWKGSDGNFYNRIYKDGHSQPIGPTPDGGNLAGPIPEATGLSNVGGTLAGIGQIGQAIGGLANAYMGWKNYKLAKEQMRFQQKLARANFANQAKQYNNMVLSGSNAAKGLAGYGKEGYENYGALTSQEAANYDKKVNESKVSEEF